MCLVKFMTSTEDITKKKKCKLLIHYIHILDEKNKYYI